MSFVKTAADRIEFMAKESGLLDKAKELSIKVADIEKQSWGNDRAMADTTNLRDPAQRATFVANDPNKESYGSRIPGSPAGNAAAGIVRRPSLFGSTYGNESGQGTNQLNNQAPTEGTPSAKPAQQKHWWQF